MTTQTTEEKELKDVEEGKTRPLDELIHELGLEKDVQN
jgi:hypothetical protein